MYNRDPVTPFQLTGNQRDGKPIQLSISEELVIMD